MSHNEHPASCAKVDPGVIGSTRGAGFVRADRPHQPCFRGKPLGVVAAGAAADVADAAEEEEDVKWN